ncbi:MAG: ATP-binding protein [Bacteroidota bacterium]
MLFLNNFIPREYQKDDIASRIVKSVVAIDVFIISSSLIFSLFYIYINFSFGYCISFYTAISSVLHILLIRYGKNPTFTSDFFVFQIVTALFAMMYFTGGATSPFSIFLLLICPMPFLFLEKKRATVWAIITGTCFIVLAALQIGGFDFPKEISDQLSQSLSLINFILSLIIFTITVREFHMGFRKINKKLKSSNSQLLNSNEELERFAYIASHDLKSPLRSIISFIGLLEKRYGKDFDENGKQFLKIISSNAENMHHLVEDILEYSKSNKRKIKSEEVNMNHVLTHISDESLSVELFQDCKILFGNLPIINSDYTLIKQVFQNLIENGLKYNQNLKKIVSIQYLDKEEHYFLIKDNGIGIDPAYFERIFEMFQRLHNKDEYQGTGIGLAICNKIILQLGGKIWVTSKVGEGSIFHITLPKSNATHTFNLAKETSVEALPVH